MSFECGVKSREPRPAPPQCPRRPTWSAGVVCCWRSADTGTPGQRPVCRKPSRRGRKARRPPGRTRTLPGSSDPGLQARSSLLLPGQGVPPSTEERSARRGRSETARPASRTTRALGTHWSDRAPCRPRPAPLRPRTSRIARASPKRTVPSRRRTCARRPARRYRARPVRRSRRNPGCRSPGDRVRGLCLRAPAAGPESDRPARIWPRCRWRRARSAERRPCLRPGQAPPPRPRPVAPPAMFGRTGRHAPSGNPRRRPSSKRSRHALRRSRRGSRRRSRRGGLASRPLRAPTHAAWVYRRIFCRAVDSKAVILERGSRGHVRFQSSRTDSVIRPSPSISISMVSPSWMGLSPM